MKIPYRKLDTFKDREKIFSPFYYTKPKGTGLDSVSRRRL
jgi:hypothetical protein